MVGDTILIKDISINGNNDVTGGLNTATADKLSETLTEKTINALGIDTSSRTIWVNGQPYGNAYVNIKEDNTVEAPIGAEIFNDFANNVASGDYSHAEGRNTSAIGDYSHAEGSKTFAIGEYSHAGGINTVASGKSSFAIGQDNEAISENSVAIGNNNIAGLKGWYYGSINKINDTTIDVYISDSQMGGSNNYPAWGGTTKLSNLNPYSVLGDNTIVSLINDVKYDNKFKVIGGESGRIRLQSVDENLPFSEIKIEALLDPDDYSIYCLSNPNAGIADMGQASFVSGYNNKATNGKATAFGFNNHAYGKFSFVEGRDNEASYASHAEGRGTIASGEYSHAEGNLTKASGSRSHAEGLSTTASGHYSHSEGRDTNATGECSHVEGYTTTASGDYSHAEGAYSHAIGIHSHAEGCETQASGYNSHAEGYQTKAMQFHSHAEGYGTITKNYSEHAEGSFNVSHENTANSALRTLHSIGIGTSDGDRKNAVEVMKNGDIYIIGIGDYNGTNPEDSKDLATILSTVDTSDTTEFIVEKDLKVDGQTYCKTVAAGNNTTASGDYSHAEGANTIASGNFSHAEGYKTETGGNYDSNENREWPAGENGLFSHAEGNATIAQGAYSHTEGTLTFTKGVGSHAEGYKTEAKGDYSHAEGYNTEANGNYSHVTGSYNIAEGENSTLQGYCLFDHGIDTEDSFIWLDASETISRGCGFIKIEKPYILDHAQSLSNDDKRKDCYEVIGSYWVNHTTRPNGWSEKLINNDLQKYYITKQDVKRIIESWNTNSSTDVNIPLTDEFKIYEYSEDNSELTVVANVKGCGWVYNKSANYGNRITEILGISEDPNMEISKAYDAQQENKEPVIFINNSATIIGQYNKPLEGDIFEVGCGRINKNTGTPNRKILQENAISVNRNGETTISKLNTGSIITTANNTNKVAEQIKQLPDVGLDFRSIICSDGILIGSSDMHYMYLKINDNGQIILGNKNSANLKEVNLTTALSWNDVPKV